MDARNRDYEPEYVDSRCGSCCQNKSNTCMCLIAVLLGHLVIGAALATALCIRLIVYKDMHHTDMPSDMRVLEMGKSEMFCSEHVITAELEKGYGLMKNTVPVFNAYLLETHPRDYRLILETRTFNMPSVASLASGGFKDLGYHFETPGNISLATCAQDEGLCQGPPGVWLFIIKGFENMDRLKDYVEKNGMLGKGQCGRDFGCLQEPAYLEPKATCTVQHPETQQFNVSIVGPRATYYFLYWNAPPSFKIVDDISHDDAMGVAKEPCAENIGQKFRSYFTLTRQQYAVEDLKPVKVNSSSVVVDIGKYPLLTFMNYLQEDDNELYNIVVKYKCTSHIIVYMGWFFAIPLVALVVIVVCTLRYQDRTGYIRLN